MIRGYHVFLALPMAIVSRAFYGLKQTPSGLDNFVFSNYSRFTSRSKFFFKTRLYFKFNFCPYCWTFFASL